MVGVSALRNALLLARFVLVMRIIVLRMIVRSVSNGIGGAIKTVFVGRTIRATQGRALAIKAVAGHRPIHIGAMRTIAAVLLRVAGTLM
jgi:hypothetical protein